MITQGVLGFYWLHAMMTLFWNSVLVYNGSAFIKLAGCIHAGYVELVVNAEVSQEHDRCEERLHEQMQAKIRL